jgi:ATP-dependent Zn protease
MSRATAYHEASHAVVARVVGLPVISVTMEPPRVLFCQDDKPLHNFILMSMAGSIGRAIFAGHKDRAGNARSRVHDAEDVREAMAALGSEAHRWNVYQAASRQLVRQHWQTIAAVADELLRERTITGARLDQIMKARK